MKLSEAILVGSVGQQYHKGYFDPAFTAADTLFSAYLGLPLASIEPVIRACGLNGTNPAKACALIQDTLLKAWPNLLAVAPEILTRVARREKVTEPRKGETLMGYVSRLNDAERLSRERIASILSLASL